MTTTESLLVDAVLDFTAPGEPRLNFQALERLYLFASEVRRERDSNAGAAANKPGAASPRLHLPEGE